MVGVSNTFSESKQCNLYNDEAQSTEVFVCVCMYFSRVGGYRSAWYNNLSNYPKAPLQLNAK